MAVKPTCYAKILSFALTLLWACHPSREEGAGEEAATATEVASGGSTVVTQPSVDTAKKTTTDTGNKVEPGIPGSEASLSVIVVSAGTLQPAFDPATTIYSVTVPHRVTNISLETTLLDSDATLKINGSSALPDYGLVVGPNAFVLEVTAEDGTTKKTYTLVISRSRQFVYVTNVDDSGPDSLSLLSVNPETGVLEPQSVPSITVGNDPYDLAVSPDGRHLYVANSLSDSVSQFEISQGTGSLVALSPATVAQGPVPYCIQFHPNGLFAWSANGANDPSGLVSQYRRDEATGVLSSLDVPYANSALNPWFLSVHPSGNYVYLTQFGSFSSPSADTVQQYQVDQNTGELSNMTPFTVATEDKPWYILTHPNGKWTYVGNFGSASISQYLVDQSTGALSAMSPATVAAGTSPVGLAMDPQGRFLYVGNSGSNSVGMYAIDQTSGALSPIGSGTLSLSDSPYGMMTDRTGRYLYVAKSAGSEVAMYAIDQLTGELTPLSPAVVSIGNRPRFFAIAD